AEPAEDAPRVVDLVGAGEPLTGRETLLVGVVAALDVDRVRRAGPGAQLAADALLQAVRVPVEDVPPVVARRRRRRCERVVGRDDLAEHVREGHPEALERTGERTHVTPPCSRRATRPRPGCVRRRPGGPWDWG